jgi:hypothetical protein
MKFLNTSQKLHYNTNQSSSHEQVKKAVKCRKSQKQAILNHLIKYSEITTLEAIKMFILAPAARIKELRDEGYNILTIKDYNKNGMATYVLENNEVNNHE